MVSVVRKNEDNLNGAVDFLTRQRIPFTPDDKSTNLRFDVNVQQLKDNEVAHKWIAQRLAPKYLINGQDLDPPDEPEEEETSLEGPSVKPSGVLAEVAKVLNEDGRWEMEFRSNGVRFMPKAWLEWLPQFGLNGDPRWWIYVWLYPRDGRLISGVDMAPLKDLAKREAIVPELLHKITEFGFKLPTSHKKEVKNNYSRITAGECIFEWDEDDEPESKKIRVAVKKAFDNLYPKLEKLASVLKPLCKASEHLIKAPQAIDSPEEQEDEESVERPSEKSSRVLAEVANLLKEDGRWEMVVRSNGILFLPKAWLEWLPQLGLKGDSWADPWWIHAWLGSDRGTLVNCMHVARLTDFAKRKEIVTTLLAEIRGFGFKQPRKTELTDRLSRITGGERILEWREDDVPEPKQIRVAVKRTLDELYPKLQKLAAVLRPLAS